MPTLPVIYGTALYALDDRAHIRAGEVSAFLMPELRPDMWTSDYPGALRRRRFRSSLNSYRATAGRHCIRNGEY